MGVVFDKNSIISSRLKNQRFYEILVSVQFYFLIIETEKLKSLFSRFIQMEQWKEEKQKKCRQLKISVRTEVFFDPHR